MPEAARPGHAFAVQNDQQYQPAEALGDRQVRVGGRAGTGLLLCHASHSPDLAQHGTQRLLIVVHGALRDSDRYLGHAEAAADQAGSRALIVAPQFLADVDVAARAGIPDGALYWDVEGWKGGQPALGPAPLSSFTAMDCLLRQLTKQLTGPATGQLTGPGQRSGGGKLAVVIIGNSAGGQYVNRYAAVGTAPDALEKHGIPVRFIVANPSTYLYFDGQRPVRVPAGSRVNHWRYGFDQAPPYVRSGWRRSLRRYLARDVTIVLGEQDTDAAALLLEVNPAAMAQGANRLERGINYDAHVRRLALAAGLPAGHRVIQLGGVGHAARDVLMAPQTRALMFG